MFVCFLACGGNVEAEYTRGLCDEAGSFGRSMTAPSLVGPTLNSLSGIMKKCCLYLIDHGESRKVLNLWISYNGLCFRNITLAIARLWATMWPD